MYMLGLVVAIPIAFFINRFLLKLKPLPFILEMPPYRRPAAASVLRRMYVSGREFTVRAGTVIFAISIIIWALSYFPAPLGREATTPPPPWSRATWAAFGKAVQPAFAPAGFDWKTTVAVLAAFPAREVVVSTLGILYSAEEDEENSELKEQMIASKSFTAATAAAVMVFFAFCLQCGRPWRSWPGSPRGNGRGSPSST